MASSNKKRKATSKARMQQRVKDFRAGIETAKTAIAPLIMRRYFLRGIAAGVVVTALLFGVALYLAYYQGILTVAL